MKHATLLLTTSVLSSFIIVACSATGTRNETTGATNGSGGTNVGGEGGSGAGNGGAGGVLGSSSSGGPSSSSGGPSSSSSGGPSSSASSSASSSSGTGGIEVGSWPVPLPIDHPPLMGNNTTEVVYGPGGDSTSPGKFGGADNPNAKPSIVYPPNGVVVPPNMRSLEIHFVPAAGQTLFEIKFQAPTKAMAIYTTCSPLGAGCVFQSTTTFWSNLVEYARGTTPVSYTIRGVNGSSPGTVGTSVTQTIAFGEQDISGGIYYWNDSGNIQRYDFGLPNIPAKLYMSQINTGATFCVGCHAISRDGTYILAGTDIPSFSLYGLYDVATKTRLQINGQPYAGQANYFSFSPNEQYFLESGGQTIAMRAVSDGTYVVPAGLMVGTMPDWSPNGLTMVYAKPKFVLPINSPSVQSASLETRQWNGAAWSSPSTLVPFAQANNYYPTYSPTGDWILFNRSPSDRDSMSNAKPDPMTGQLPDGELWVVSANGGTPIRLSTASNPGALSWPKWAPVLNEYYGGQILWATFSSSRAYGLRLADGQKTQIWMMGFDLQKAAAGQDPSLPAFWFPYQSINSGNHIAQWSTKVLRQPCSPDKPCDSVEMCVNGACLPKP